MHTTLLDHSTLPPKQREIAEAARRIQRRGITSDAKTIAAELGDESNQNVNRVRSTISYLKMKGQWPIDQPQSEANPTPETAADAEVANANDTWAGVSSETGAIVRMASILQSLPSEARPRVWAYLSALFGLNAEQE